MGVSLIGLAITNTYLCEISAAKVQKIIQKTAFGENINTIPTLKLTLATIPAQPASLNTSSKTKKFTYAPQAALEVPESVEELDLTAQLTVAKGELNPTADESAGTAAYATWLENMTTTFSFVTASGTALVENTDYSVTEPGKFKFLKEQTEKVHGVMANEGFPLFTGADAFVTTEFTVDLTQGIKDINAVGTAGKVYNLQGVEVAQPVKGLYIQNGKKVIVK